MLTVRSYAALIESETCSPTGEHIDSNRPHMLARCRPYSRLLAFRYRGRRGRKYLPRFTVLRIMSDSLAAMILLPEHQSYFNFPFYRTYSRGRARKRPAASRIVFVRRAPLHV